MRETVFVLHGLNRTQLSMAWLAGRLRSAGYAVCNRHYATRSRTLEEHADMLLERVAAEREPGGGAVHFVTHSLGGLVVRCALHRCAPGRPPLDAPGRFVMLGTPNQGSELAQQLAHSRAWSALLGRQALEVLADGARFAQWGPPPLVCGVIAGGRGDGRGWNPLLHGDDDGVVTVAGTHVEGEADHLVLPAFHTALPWRRDVAEQVLHFLRHGRFARMRPDAG